MKISILCNGALSHAHWDKDFVSEWGFSVYVQAKTANILFDTGKTGIYKHNAAELGIDLDRTDFVVISHHHADHAAGLMHHGFSAPKKLLLHPHVLEAVPPVDAEKMKRDFQISASESPVELCPGVFFLGHIPRTTGFEKGTCGEDAMPDDSALAITSGKGAVVLTGCSHSGICNICEYAEKVTGQKTYAVMGGFHLSAEDPETVENTIRYFRQKRVSELYPMHCIDFPTQVRFYSEFGTPPVCTGDMIELDD